MARSEWRWGKKGSLILYLRGRGGALEMLQIRSARRHARRDPACVSLDLPVRSIGRAAGSGCRSASGRRGITGPNPAEAGKTCADYDAEQAENRGGPVSSQPPPGQSPDRSPRYICANIAGSRPKHGRMHSGFLTPRPYSDAPAGSGGAGRRCWCARPTRRRRHWHTACRVESGWQRRKTLGS